MGNKFISHEFSALRNQLWIDTAKWFASMPGEAAVHYLLGRLGMVHKADRVFLVQEDKKRSLLYITHEWCAPKMPPSLSSYKTVMVEPFKWLKKTLERKKELCLDTRKLPKGQIEVRYRLAALGVQTAMYILVHNGNTIQAALGYHRVLSGKHWTYKEREETRIAADILSGWYSATSQRFLGEASKMEITEQSIFIKSGSSSVAFPINRIISVEAALNYTKVFVRGEKPIIKHRSLESWLSTLPSEHFLRVHRSYIVTPGNVTKLSRNGGSWLLTMSDGREIPVGRTYRANLMRVLKTQMM